MKLTRLKLYYIIISENVETKQKWHDIAVKRGYNFIHDMIVKHSVKDTKLAKLVA
jgi:hypothetical protein